MKKIDKYISSIFIYILIFTLIAFACIFIIVEVIQRIDIFIDRNVPFPVIVKFHIYYLPYIIVLILPASVLIACLFSMGQLARRNELAALKASGLSLYRIITPILVVAFFISLFSLFFAEMVVPGTSQKKQDIDDQYLRNTERRRTGRNIYFQDSKERVISIRYYNDKSKRAHQVNFTYHKENEIVKRVQAETMTWEDTVWVLNKASVREFKGDNEIMNKYDKLPYPGLNFGSEELLDIELKPEEMGFFKLREFIKRRRTIGIDVEKWIVEMHLKISFPFANLIIVLFGVPLVSQHRRGGGAIGFGIALVICFFFFGTVRVGQYLGYSGMLHPLLAAWLGNIIFTILGIFLLIKAKK